jgi:hypothetical protein
MSKVKTARFEVTGEIDVKGYPVRDLHQNICGYRQKDGSIVMLAVALEVQDKTGNKFHYLTTDKDMRALGFGIIDYDQTEFVNTKETAQW